MELKIPFENKLYEVLNDNIFKRKLVLWHYYIKKMNPPEISKNTKIQPSTIYAILKKWKFEGDINDGQRSGRPMEISLELQNKIITMQEKERTRSIKSIYSEVRSDPKENEKCSYDQTRRLIHKNFRVSYAPYKIMLSDANKVKRVKWIINHQTWRKNKWNRVVWTDEKIFRLSPFNKKIQVKIRFDENIKDFSIPKKQQGGGGIMFWGAISTYGKIHLAILDGKIDSKKFSEFLEYEAIPVIKKNICNPLS